MNAAGTHYDGPADEFHYHEFMDRTHAVAQIFSNMVVDHMVAPEFKPQIDVLADLLNKLYQSAAAKRFEDKP